MFKMTVSGKCSAFTLPSKPDVHYGAFFTLTYRGFMGDNKTEKNIIVLVEPRQMEFAKKQCEKGYTLIIEAKGLSAWADKQGDIHLALDKVDLIIP